MPATTAPEWTPTRICRWEPKKNTFVSQVKLSVIIITYSDTNIKACIKCHEQVGNPPAPYVGDSGLKYQDTCYSDGLSGCSVNVKDM